MKTLKSKPLLLLIALLSVITTAALAQIPADSAQSTEPPAPEDYVITERGPNHHILEATHWETTRSGRLVPRKKSITALATGMNFFSDGQWRESRELFEPCPGGAIARFGQHRLFAANDLATPGAIVLEMPDGKKMVSGVLGISLFDGQKSVFIGQVKSCQGVIIPPNQILWSSAFDGIEASVRLTYTLAGCEQDVLIEEAPVLPEGFNAAETRLQIFTELFDLPPPNTSDMVAKTVAGVAMPDQPLIEFGSMSIGPGKAFSIGKTGAAINVPVCKQIERLDGRDFLIEEIPLAAVQKALAQSPKDQGASLAPSPKRIQRTAAATRTLPSRPAPRRSGGEMQLAQNAPALSGVLVDYITLSTSATNYVFKTDQTYLINAPVYLAGTTVLEPLTTLKFPVSSTARVITSNVLCLGKSFQPITLTSRDDNGIGESFGNGNPSGYYGYIGLDLSTALTNQTLNNVRFRYLSNAVAGVGVTLRNSQVIRCKNGFTPGVSTPILENVLIERVDTFVPAEWHENPGDYLVAQNVTARFCTNLLIDTSGEAYFTNCLFVSVGNWLCNYTVTNACAFLDSDAGVFQGVGAGSYLAAQSPYRNSGTTNISASLLHDLRQKTTCPPIVFSNVTFSTDLTLSPQAQRDTDQIDLGWHPDPIDYLFGGCHANANITFQPGTAVGWFRTTQGWCHAGHGIHIGDTKTVTFNGTAEAPCYWVRRNLVQEGLHALWEGYGPGGLTSWGWPSFSYAGKIRARFTKLIASAEQQFRDDWGYLDAALTNSEMIGGNCSGYSSLLTFTNCLFERSLVGHDHTLSEAENETYNCDLVLQNCTFHGGLLGVRRWAGSECDVCGPATCYNPNCGSTCCAFLCYCEYCGHSCCDCAGCDCEYCNENHLSACDCSAPPIMFCKWIIKDTAFDATALAFDDGANADPSVTDFNYNAFLTNQSRTVPQGPNDVIVTNFNWLSSWFGNYYLPTNSSLVNTGSVSSAAAVGLYHFTTQTNQVIEGTSRLDIGLHWVATDAYGHSLDYDGDGTPDYVENVDGDADDADDPTSWRSYNSRNGLTSGFGLQVFTPLK